MVGREFHPSSSETSAVAHMPRSSLIGNQRPFGGRRLGRAETEVMMGDASTLRTYPKQVGMGPLVVVSFTTQSWHPL